MRRNTAPRLTGFPYRGVYRYFLTFCTDHRARVFLETNVVEAFIAQLLQTATREHFAVLAYCFMPDHLHALLEGTSDASDMRAFVRRWKQVSGYAWKRQTGADLWQRSYFEHTLREDEDALSIARYLISNSLRAGLVENVLDYPFIGSQVMSVRDLIYSFQMDRQQ